MRLFLFLFSLFVTNLPLSAAASSSSWMESEGGAVRVVTTGLADDEGRLRGALEIRLEPGWKTYWRAPGEAGIPPEIHLSGLSDVSAATLHFPAPERIHDAYASWAGYKQSVTLPVTFTATPGGSGIVEGEVTLGICETICIPFQSEFTFDAGADPDNVEHAMLVNNAFAALPEKPRSGFQVKEISRKGDRLLLNAEIPAGKAAPQLFLATPEVLRLGTPKLVDHNGDSATFSADILDPRNSPSRMLTLDYTLVDDQDAVNGTIAVP